jgi:hypothetical protein
MLIGPRLIERHVASHLRRSIRRKEEDMITGISQVIVSVDDQRALDGGRPPDGTPLLVLSPRPDEGTRYGPGQRD